MRNCFRYVVTGLIVCFLLNFTGLHAQLKLGANPSSINKSSVLELDSRSQGLLLTRVPDTTVAPLNSAPDGMIIYFTADSSLRLRKAGSWQKIADGINFWQLAGAAGGDLTGTYPNPTLRLGAVTYNKIQNVTAGTLLGRYTNSAGVLQEITLGSGLALDPASGQLTASGLGGTVTSVGSGYGLLGGPITTTGTLVVDSATLSAYYIRRKDSSVNYVTPYYLSSNYATIAGLNTRLNISDTAAMLATYVRGNRLADTATALRTLIATKLNISDTAGMLSTYVRGNRLTDTATALRALIATKGGGTVTGITATGTNGITASVGGTTAVPAITVSADTSTASAGLARKSYADNLAALKVNIADTANMLSTYVRGNRLTDTSTALRALIATRGSGSVTNVGSGYGLTGGPITTTGTLVVDSATLSGYYLRRKDSSVNYITPYAASTAYATIANLATKVNISDTANMLSTYVRGKRLADTSGVLRTLIATKLNTSDTAGMLATYVRGNRLADTATALRSLIATKGGVTNVGSGYGLTGGPITTSGTLVVDSATLSGYYLRRKDSATNYVTPNAASITYATIAGLATKENISDTANMLATYVRGNRLTDTSTALRALIATKGSGTVTSVATGYGLAGGPVINTGTLTADTSAAALSGYYLRRKDSSVNYVTPYFLSTSYTPANTAWLLGGNSVAASNKFGNITANDLPFITANIERMRIGSTGYVGVGVTDAANPLVVRDTFEIRHVNSAGVGELLFTNVGGTNGNFRIGSDGTDIFWQGGGGKNLQMGAYWGMIFTGDRQGTGFPAFSTGIAGTGTLMQSSRAASVPLGIAGVSGQTANLTEWRTSGGTVLSAVNTNGYIGIGTAAPSTALHVVGTNPLTLSGVQVGTNTSTDSVLTIAGGLVKKLPASTFAPSAGTWLLGGNAVNGYQALGTTTNYSLPIITNNTERMRIDSLGNVAIGTTTFDATNPEQLIVDAGVTTSVNAIYARGTINNYFQTNIRNLSSGTQASSDIVATANNGTETTNFVDLGINGSGYTYQNGNPIETGAANDGYLLSAGNNFYIVNNNATKSMIFLTGGTANANEAMRITNTGNIGVGFTATTATTPGVAAKVDIRGTFKMGVNGTVLTSMIKGQGVTGNSSNISGGGGSADFTFAVTNAATGSVVNASPAAALPSGVSIAYAYVSSAGNVTIRLVNSSVTLIGVPITQTLPSGTTFNVIVTQ